MRTSWHEGAEWLFFKSSSDTTALDMSAHRVTKKEFERGKERKKNEWRRASAAEEIRLALWRVKQRVAHMGTCHAEEAAYNGEKSSDWF